MFITVLKFFNKFVRPVILLNTCQKIFKIDQKHQKITTRNLSVPFSEYCVYGDKIPAAFVSAQDKKF